MVLGILIRRLKLLVMMKRMSTDSTMLIAKDLMTLVAESRWGRRGPWPPKIFQKKKE